MIVKARDKGQQRRFGAGYCFLLKLKDRDTYFNENWSIVLLTLPGYEQEIKVDVSKITNPSFWHDYPELGSGQIGQWLTDNKYVPWAEGQAPEFELVQTSENHFALRLLADKTESP